MDELTIITRQEPGTASLDNFDEIKEYLDKRLDFYRNIAYTEDSLKVAKKDKASLNALKRALDTRRKEIKAIYMEPYLRIETQIKELIAMINEPLASIDGFVKGMEEREKDEKRAEIREWYMLYAAAPLGDMAEKIFDSEGFFEKKWLNKTCRAPEWQSEVREKAARCADDVRAIKATSGAHTAAVLTKYVDNLDMEETAAFKRRLESTAEAVQSVPAPDAAPVPFDDGDRVTGYKVLRLTGTRRQMAQILEQAELLGMEVEEIEDGMPGELAELTEPDFDSFVCFDIETTGTFGAAAGDAPAEIIEIGAVKVVNGVVAAREDWLCDPGRKIVPRIARLTGITDEMLADKPSVGEIIRAFADFADDLPLVGHNIKSSDLHYITRAAKRAGVRIENSFFDTYLYAKRFREANGWESVKLEYLADLFGIEQNSAHRAWCDAEANVGVFFKLKEMR